jgi:hypothetical protein
VKSPKSNLNFELIEFEIPEKELDFIKKSISQGCIKRVDQITGNKWHYLLKTEDSLLEIEIIYNRSNIKQFQCACGARSPEKICKHVRLISYWHVNTIKSKNDGKGYHSNAAGKNLNNSSEEDLRYYLQFLSKQSRLNREWLNFFDVTRSAESPAHEKYITALANFNGFIETYTRNSASRLKLKLQLFEELYFISFHHYKKSNIEDALFALLVAIDQLHEWHYAMEYKNQNRLITVNKKLHNALEQFLSTTMAPATLTKVYKTILEIINQPHYQILDESSNLFAISKQHKVKNSESLSLFKTLLLKLGGKISEECRLHTLDYLYKEFPIQLKNYLITIEISNSIYWVIQWIESRKKQISPDYMLELYKHIFEIAPKDIKSIVASRVAELYKEDRIVKDDLLLKYYLELGNASLLQTYFRYNEVNPDHFEFFLNNLEKNIVKRELTISQKADLAYHSQQWTVLLHLLSESDDVDFILKFDTSFPEEYHPHLISAYITLSKSYLESHVGQKSHQKINSIARHIRSVYRNKLYKTYLDEIRNLFPNRKLMIQI